MEPVALVLVLLVAVSAPGGIEEALRQAARLEAAGDTDGATKAYRTALDQAAPGSRERARTLVALSVLETSLGQYADSREHAREAAAIFASRGEAKEHAYALNVEGLAALYAGAYADAAAAFQRAITISSDVGDRESHAKELTNLANVFLYLGRYAEAARTYDEALHLTEAAAGEEWAPRRRRLLLVNKATLFQRLGRYQQALALYRGLGSGGDVRPEEEAQVLVNIGVLYRRLGDPIKALASYDEAVGLFVRNRHVNGELNVKKSRAVLLALDLERFDEAERSFSEVLKLAARIGNRRELLVTHLFRGETRLRAGLVEGARADFAAGLALARELHTREEEWKALYGLGRTTSQLEAARNYLRQAVAVIEGIREGIRVPSMRSDFFSDKREVYDALIAAVLAHASVADTFALIERGHSRAWRDRLGLSGSVDLAAVQRVLRPDVLLLDYWSSHSGSALVAVTRTRAAVMGITVDEPHVRALIDGLAAGPGTEWRRHAQSIAADVLPAADWFNGIEHVIIVADGALALVPFEVLSTSDGLLIQRAAISYTPTAATLLGEAPPTPSWQPPWRLQLEAFGDPAVTPADIADSLPRPRLHSSAQEVRAIASELGGAAALHVGRDNRKAYLTEVGQRAPILHLATHAMADANALEQSRIVFSPPGKSAPGADYLYLREAYDLPLTGVEMAVLSACETERGPSVRGEGVQSFSRAFIAAGARSTVTTLWPVADVPTADFMKVFYHHLQRGASRDEALRRAKLRFLASDSVLADPHFWAAFVLTGDGLRPVPRAVSWRAVLVSVFVLLVLLSLGLIRLTRRRRSHADLVRA